MKKNLMTSLFAAVLAVCMIASSGLAATTPVIALDRALYNIGMTIVPTVTDGDSNASATAADTAILVVSSQASGETVYLQLQETGVDTAIFQKSAGAFTLSSASNSTTVSTLASPVAHGGAAVLKSAISDTLTFTLTNVNGVAGTKTQTISYQTGTFSGSTSSIFATANTATIGSDVLGKSLYVSGATDGGNIKVMLKDNDLNTNTGAAEAGPVMTVTTDGGQSQTLTLKETDVNTGVFSGVIAAFYAGTAAITAGDGVENDGNVANDDGTDTICVVPILSSGDKITVAYPSAIGFRDVIEDGTQVATAHEIIVSAGSPATLEINKTEFNRGNRLVVTLTDADLNTSSSSYQTLSTGDDNATIVAGEVLVTSAQGAGALSLHLTETAPGSGVFTSEVELDPSETTATGEDYATGDNKLKVGANDVITVSYLDALDGDTDTTNNTSSKTATYQMVTGSISVSPSVLTSGTTAFITVTDADLNTDATTIQTLTSNNALTVVNVTGEASKKNDVFGSTANSAFTLTETGPDTGIFTGKMVMDTLATAKADDAKFQADDGETITFTYSDAANAAGTAVSTASVSIVATTNVGVVTLDRSAYNVGDTMTVTVVDADLNTNPNEAQSFTAAVNATNGVGAATNLSSGANNFKIVETGADTGIFKGTMVLGTASNFGGTANATVTSQPGDTITITYNDGGTATANKRTATASISSHSGTISVDKDITNTSGTKVTVTVTDADLNKSHTAVDTNTTALTVKSSSLTSGVTRTLTETGPNTGVFTATYIVGTTLAAANGDTIAAIYTDARNSAGATNTLVQAYSTASETLGTLESDLSTAVLGGTVTITVTDEDGNTNAAAKQTLSVSVTSTSDPIGMTLTLQETGDNTGVFTKSFDVVSTATVENSRILAAEGDTVSLKYADLSDNNPNTLATAAATTKVTASLAVETAAAFASDVDSLALTAGQTAGTVVFSGGVTAYSITTPADAAIATATIDGSTVTVTPVAAGSTSFVVSDNAIPAATLTITVEVAAAPTPVGGTEVGKVDVAIDVETSYDISVNTTPKAGDTPAQEWIIIGGTNNVSGAVWYFAYNGTTFELVESAAAVFSGTLTTPSYQVHPNLNLAQLGYTAADGGNLWVAYAYTTEATGTFADLLTAGKIVMDNITDLTVQ